MRLDNAASAVNRQQLLNNAQGVISERGNYETFSVASASPTSQLVVGCLVGLRAGDSVTGIRLRVRTAAVGTAPTTARFGIADSSGVMLAISGNLNTAASWVVGATPFAFASPYTILTDGGYFICFVVNGTWGSTQPLLSNRAILAGVSSANAATGFAPVSFSWSGQTDLPAVGGSLTLTGQDTTGLYLAAYGTAVT